MRRICVQWPRFGPYHLARLEAARAFLEPKGVQLIGLETAGRDATYAWRVEDAPTSFQREQVFPDRSFEALPPAEVHAGVTAALDRLDPDAVAITSYSFPDARACLAWCRRRRRTAVVMTDSKEDDAPRTPVREWIKARLLAQFDAALVAGTPHRAYLERLGFPGDRIFAGFDVVDNDFFRRGAEAARRTPEACRDLPGLAEPTPFLLASSRFIARKNLDLLLLAYARYRHRSAAPWRLVILGDGPERPRLEHLVATERIESVTLAGFCQIDRLPAYYGLAGAFVHPARADQWGLVVNEAMAAGLPVLVSAQAGCAEDLVREGENGFRFDAADRDGLADLLDRITAPEAARAEMGRRSQEIIAGWSPRRFAESLWEAVEAGRAHADRGPDPDARLILWLLRTTARSASSFHSVES